MGLALVWIYRNRRGLTVNDVTTGESFAYPDLRAHVYFAEAEAAFEAAVSAIKGLSGWRLVHAEPESGTLFAEAEARFGGFLSDVIVTVSPLGERHSRVVIRSVSRLGRGDLGENARHIRALQSAMDERLVGG